MSSFSLKCISICPREREKEHRVHLIILTHGVFLWVLWKKGWKDNRVLFLMLPFSPEFSV